MVLSPKEAVWWVLNTMQPPNNATMTNSSAMVLMRLNERENSSISLMCDSCIALIPLVSMHTR